MASSSNTTTAPAKLSVHYVLIGLRLLLRPGIRRFVLIPLLINVAIFGVIGWYLSAWVGAWLNPTSLDVSDGWLSHFAWLQAALAWITSAIVFLANIAIWVTLAWVYTLVANIIGAPFNSLLAERVESHLTGREPPAGSTFGALIREVPRTLISELAKLWYLASRFLALFLLSLVPLVNVVAAPLLLLFGAWVFALEYLDYPLGNHGLRFREVRQSARQHPIKSLGFGAGVALISTVPLLNLIIMPAAVAGATALWLDAWEEAVV